MMFYTCFLSLNFIKYGFFEFKCSFVDYLVQ